MKVLVIRFSALGDVAMTVPVINTFACQHPDYEIKVLTRARFAPLFSWMPENVETIGVNLDDYKGVLGLKRLFDELKTQHFDVVADLHDVLRSKILRWFFRMYGCRVSVIDKGRKEKKELMGNGMTHEPLKPMQQRYWEALNADSECCAEVPDFSSVGPARKSGEDNGAISVGIAPFAAYETKMYPLDMMKKVVEGLRAKGMKVFLFGGGAKEKAILQEWECDGVTSMCGRLSGLKEELEFMSGLDLMIAMDSGNLHLASMMGVKTLSVWGATHPKAGFVPEESVVMEKDCPCRPCSIYGNKPCRYGDLHCLRMIEPEEIVDLVNSYQFTGLRACSPELVKKQ